LPPHEDGHQVTVMRYVERNPVRAGLMRQAEAWPWSIAAARDGKEWQEFLKAGPVPLPRGGLGWSLRFGLAVGREKGRKVECPLCLPFVRKPLT
jgi:sensor domain CHASE-containing protein